MFRADGRPPEARGLVGLRKNEDGGDLGKDEQEPYLAGNACLGPI